MAAVGLRLFPAYLRVVDRVLIEYSLEPAGSHGAWSLDDYHCLPFVWGSAQLCASVQAAADPAAATLPGQVPGASADALGAYATITPSTAPDDETLAWAAGGGSNEVIAAKAKQALRELA